MEEYLILKEINQANLINNYILNAKTLQELELMNIEHEEILNVSSGVISICCPNRIIEYIKCLRKCNDAKIRMRELRIKGD